MRLRILGIAGLVLAATAGQVQAAFITTIDQQNLVANTSVSSTQVYQTFVPTLSGIDAAEFNLRTANPSIIGSAFLRIYDGAGLGTVLGSSTSQVVANFAVFQAYHFDFISTVALTPGSTYTLSIISTQLFSIESSGDNSYASGAMVNANGDGIFGGDLDFVFTEGLHSSPVPEPASLAMWSVMGGIGFMARRRRKKA